MYCVSSSQDLVEVGMFQAEGTAHAKYGGQKVDDEFEKKPLNKAGM